MKALRIALTFTVSGAESFGAPQAPQTGEAGMRLRGRRVSYP